MVGRAARWRPDKQVEKTCGGVVACATGRVQDFDEMVVHLIGDVRRLDAMHPKGSSETDEVGLPEVARVVHIPATDSTAALNWRQSCWCVVSAC